MHSSRMRTARTLTVGGGGGFSIPGGSPSQGGIPCDLSHNAFDVTCMLPPHQLRHIKCAAAYIVWPRCMLGYIPPPVDRITDTCKNITFPQLRLRAVKIVDKVNKQKLIRWHKSNIPRVKLCNYPQKGLLIVIKTFIFVTKKPISS